MVTLAEILRSKQVEEDKANKDQEYYDRLIGLLDELSSSQVRIESVLNKILERPLPSYPPQKEFPKVQKVQMDKPDWYGKEGKIEYPDISKPLVDLKKSIVSEGVKTRKILEEILKKQNSEGIVDTVDTRPIKTVNTGSLRTRRTVIWVKASLADGKIIRSNTNDTDFYLPSEPILNSETVRLNNGSPASSGEDYTLTGNLLRFIQSQPRDSTVLEVRYQRK